MVKDSNEVINKYTLQLKNKELRRQYEEMYFQVAMKNIRNISLVMAVRSLVQIVVLIYNEDNYLKMFIYFSLYMIGGILTYTFSRIFPRYVEIVHTIHIFLFISLILWSFSDSELRAEVEGEKNITPFVRGFSLCVLVFIYNVSCYFVVKVFLLAYIFLLIIITVSSNPTIDCMKLIPLFFSLIYREYCEDKSKKKSFLLQKKDDVWDHLTDKLLPTSLIILKWDEANMRLDFYSQNRQARQAFNIKSTEDFNEFARKFIVNKLSYKPQVQKSQNQRRISWDNTLLNNIINKISQEKDIYSKTKSTLPSFSTQQRQFQFFPEFKNQEMKEEEEYHPEEQLGEIEQLVGEFRKENFEIQDKGDLFSVRIAAYFLNDWFGVVSIENESFRERFIRQNSQQISFTQQIIKNYQYLYSCSRQNIISSSLLYNQIQELQKSTLDYNQQALDSFSVSPQAVGYPNNIYTINKQVQQNEMLCTAQTQTSELILSDQEQKKQLLDFESPRFFCSDGTDPAASASNKLKNEAISLNPRVTDEDQQQKKTNSKQFDICLNKKSDSQMNSRDNRLKWKYIAQENIKAIYNSMLLKVTVQNQLILLQKQGFLKNYQDIFHEKQVEGNILKIVNNISNTMANKLSEKGSQIKIQFDPFLPPTVSTYHTKLSQLLFNCFNLFMLNLPENNTLSLSITPETVQSCSKNKPTPLLQRFTSPSIINPSYAPPQVSPRHIEQTNQIEKDKSISQASSRFPLVNSPIRHVDYSNRYFMNNQEQQFANCEEYLSSKENSDSNEKDIHLKFQFSAKMNDFVSLSLLKQPQDLQPSVFCRVEPAFSNPAILAIESIVNEIGPYSQINITYDPKTENIILTFFIYQKIPKIRIGKSSLFLKEYEGEKYKNYNEHMLNLAIKNKQRDRSTEIFQQDIVHNNNDQNPRTKNNTIDINQQQSFVNDISLIGSSNKRGERERKAREKQMKYYSSMKFGIQERHSSSGLRESNYKSIPILPQTLVSSELSLTGNIDPQILKTNTKTSNFKSTSPNNISQDFMQPQLQQSLVLFTSSSDIMSQQDSTTIK